MPGHNFKILIADDDEGDRKQIRKALQLSKLSHECTETSSIEEALAVCTKTSFDCAFIDYCLPGQDGLEGILALHETYPYMAIIMSSGHGDEMIASAAIKLGAQDYIPKTHLNSDSVTRVFQNAVEKVQLQRKLDEQRGELENFANVLVHDLKSPTFSIQSFAEFIQQAIAGGNMKAATKHCQRVIEIARRMEELVETLHQYTLAEAKVAFAPVDMRLVMRDTLSNLQNMTEQRGALVTYDALPTVTGNASLLIQLMQNLIGNSIKYCVVEPPLVHISSHVIEQSKWLFSIKDNGIGIPEREYRTVFEPFKRLHGASKYVGTGLGLATCRKIVKRHGGDIWCQSIVGKETTFFFTLSKA